MCTKPFPFKISFSTKNISCKNSLERTIIEMQALQEILAQPSSRTRIDPESMSATIILRSSALFDNRKSILSSSTMRLTHERPSRLQSVVVRGDTPVESGPDEIQTGFRYSSFSVSLRASQGHIRFPGRACRLRVCRLTGKRFRSAKSIDTSRGP